VTTLDNGWLDALSREREMSGFLIVAPPTIVQGGTTQTANVKEFHDVNLTCNAIGFPTPNISWVRVNGNVLPPPYNRYAVRVITLSVSLHLVIS